MVPNEAAQVPQWRYLGARQAVWPQADFVVGNPPFIGKLKMREALGDGYVEALRTAWTDVPDSADFVMHWWARAAALVAAGQVERMGLITTNSLTMIFNRRVVQSALDGALLVGELPVVNSAGAGIAGGLILSKAQKSAPGNSRTGAPRACKSASSSIKSASNADSASTRSYKLHSICTLCQHITSARKAGWG
jgi:hypothetical protein